MLNTVCIGAGVLRCVPTKRGRGPFTMHIKMSIRIATAAILMGLVGEAGAFYLPGVAPRKYKSGERMRVKVNTLTSDLTPLQVIAVII